MSVNTEQQHCWYVYIVECRDNTLYTGVATDVDRRVQQHNDGTGAKYTSGRRPVSLVHVESQPDRGAALRREHQIKCLSVKQKRLLFGHV